MEAELGALLLVFWAEYGEARQPARSIYRPANVNVTAMLSAQSPPEKPGIGRKLHFSRTKRVEMDRASVSDMPRRHGGVACGFGSEVFGCRFRFGAGFDASHVHF